MKHLTEPRNAESTRNASRRLAVAVVALLLAPVAAHSQLTVTCTQVAADVVCTSPTGTLDLTGLPLSGTFTFAGNIAPPSAVFVTAPSGGVLADGYNAASISKPASFGSLGQTWGSSGSGILGISPNYLVVPKGYVSGSPIAPTSMTFSGKTATALGVTPGVYVWTWGSGLPAQKFTLNLFSSAPVPPTPPTTGKEFAKIQIVATRDLVASLDSSQVTTAGNRTAFQNFLNQALAALQADDKPTAIDRLEMAIARTDGCVLRGSHDGTGPEQRDWITDCGAQAKAHRLLNDALKAL